MRIQPASAKLLFFFVNHSFGIEKFNFFLFVKSYSYAYDADSIQN